MKRHKLLAILVMTGAPLLNLCGQTVTAVEGESWLKHLHREFNRTNMGKTWRFGPPPPAPGQKLASWEPNLTPGLDCKTFTLRGADLYRFNCRGCHEEAGLGAPPEINSLINPVRATSVSLIVERMKNAGMEMSRADAAALAKQANAALLDRLHKGGIEMPAFPQLSDREIQALLPFLRQMAGVPGAEKEKLLTQSSALHIGEQIVKSTCHTCHGASGPNPTPQQLLDGAIPPLSVLTRRVTLSQFVRKVTQGSPILMGAPPLLYRGRMSVFYYLTEDEAACAYLYLTAYPPHN